MQSKATVKKKHNFREWSTCLVLLFLMLILSRNPSNTVKSSLKLCYSTVIPAVFPFMILSSLLLYSGTHKLISSILKKPIKFIFGCSENATSAIVLGFLCGFPVGAVSARTLYENGEISKPELNRLMLFINNPSAAFVIGGVGVGIFDSAEVGRIIYLSIILSSFTVGIVSRFIFPTREECKHALASSQKSSPLSEAFTRAIGDSAINTLTVCACVVFFSIPVALVSDLFKLVDFPPLIRSLVSAFFEISGGCSSTSTLPSPTEALMVCAFSASWSGLSVHLQIFSVCGKCELSFTPYIISKLFQGLLSPLIVYLLSKSASSLAFNTIDPSISASPNIQTGLFCLFIISLAVTSIRRFSYNRNERRCIR